MKSLEEILSMSTEEYKEFCKSTEEKIQKRKNQMVDFSKTLQSFQTTIIQLKLAEKKLDLLRQATEQRYENAVKNRGYMIPYRRNYLN